MGISLLSVIGKVFTEILNGRLISWADTSGKLNEEQLGFRRGYSTIDNCFTLQCLILNRMVDLTVFLLIFPKAFDFVNHKVLDYVLLKNDFDTKIAKPMKSMYQNMECV